MTLTFEIPDDAKDVKVSMTCDGKQYYHSDRYRPGYWNGINGGMYYCQYFDMEDTNRIAEMTEVVSALRDNRISYEISKMKRRYRIAVPEKDYHSMSDGLRERIYRINCYHDRT